ncbi:phosphatase PAP2 family protein [Tomitella gaofuii]|uniref:phosphatase PAP2 family protein n=1 Tax=Tomitella gaofuii TaxID=2760083 RepID=UPI0015F93DA3|nr:hypothetical protein [Tomitella gaofuii]
MADIGDGAGAIAAEREDSAEGRAPGRARPARWAKAVTDVGAPWVLNAVLPVWFGVVLGAPWWGVFVAVTAGVLPICMIVAMMVRRRVADVHVTDRSERTAVLGGIIALVLAGVVIEALASAPAWALVVGTAGLATILAVGAVTVAGRWKVSVHTAVAGGWVVLAAALVTPWALLAAPSVAVIGWSRVALGDHTKLQVIAGAVLGAVICGVASLWA